MSAAPPRLSDRTFGFAFAGVFAGLAAAVWLAKGTIATWAIGIAVAFLATAALRPTWLLPLNRIWHRLTGVLGRTSNAVLLGLFFLVFFVPVGMILRALGKDPMERGVDRRRASYWSPVNRQANASTFRDQF